MNCVFNNFPYLLVPETNALLRFGSDGPHWDLKPPQSIIGESNTGSRAMNYVLYSKRPGTDYVPAVQTCLFNPGSIADLENGFLFYDTATQNYVTTDLPEQDTIYATNQHAFVNLCDVLNFAYEEGHISANTTIQLDPSYFWLLTVNGSLTITDTEGGIYLDGEFNGQVMVATPPAKTFVFSNECDYMRVQCSNVLS